MPTLLLWWILLASAVFLITCAVRGLKYARAPVRNQPKIVWRFYKEKPE